MNFEYASRQRAEFHLQLLDVLNSNIYVIGKQIEMVRDFIQ